MAIERKTTEETTGTRVAILDATEKIMREEGYAAVSSRKVAKAAGLKSQLVYYHFGTMDELFLAVYHRQEEKYFDAHAKALASRNPLRALWQLNVDVTGTELVLELIALANHRKAIRKEIARSTERYRRLQTAVLSRVLEDVGAGAQTPPAEVLSFFITAVSRALINEAAVGACAGHAAVLAYVEQRLEELERCKAAPGPAATPA